MLTIIQTVIATIITTKSPNMSARASANITLTTNTITTINIYTKKTTTHLAGATVQNDDDAGNVRDRGGSLASFAMLLNKMT